MTALLAALQSMDFPDRVFDFVLGALSSRDGRDNSQHMHRIMLNGYAQVFPRKHLRRDSLSSNFQGFRVRKAKNINVVLLLLFTRCV
ncbi:MAG: hypothetical protein R3F42_03365 [Pseudomonadota bacterium]